MCIVRLFHFYNYQFSDGKQTYTRRVENSGFPFCASSISNADSHLRSNSPNRPLRTNIKQQKRPVKALQGVLPKVNKFKGYQQAQDIHSIRSCIDLASRDDNTATTISRHKTPLVNCTKALSEKRNVDEKQDCSFVSPSSRFFKNRNCQERELRLFLNTFKGRFFSEAASNLQERFCNGMGTLPISFSENRVDALCVGNLVDESLANVQRSVKEIDFAEALGLDDAFDDMKLGIEQVVTEAFEQRHRAYNSWLAVSKRLFRDYFIDKEILFTAKQIKLLNEPLESELWQLPTSTYAASLKHIYLISEQALLIEALTDYSILRGKEFRNNFETNNASTYLTISINMTFAIIRNQLSTYVVIDHSHKLTALNLGNSHMEMFVYNVADVTFTNLNGTSTKHTVLHSSSFSFLIPLIEKNALSQISHIEIALLNCKLQTANANCKLQTFEETKTLENCLWTQKSDRAEKEKENCAKPFNCFQEEQVQQLFIKKFQIYMGSLAENKKISPFPSIGMVVGNLEKTKDEKQRKHRDPSKKLTLPDSSAVKTEQLPPCESEGHPQTCSFHWDHSKKDTLKPVSSAVKTGQLSPCESQGHPQTCSFLHSTSESKNRKLNMATRKLSESSKCGGRGPCVSPETVNADENVFNSLHQRAVSETECRRQFASSNENLNSVSTTNVSRQLLSKQESDESNTLSPSTTHAVDFSVLQAATNNFNELLGTGSFGKVFLANLNLDANKNLRPVAVKKFKPPKDNKPSRLRLNKKQFSSEMKALNKCRHPNIVKLLAYSIDGPELCIVYELLGEGDMQTALSKDNPHPIHWEERVRMSRDLSDALYYLHASCGIAHRDVKTANVLLGKENLIKLADFGLATNLERVGNLYKSFFESAAVGTKCYMAPEAMKGKVSQAVDAYAFGMVLYEIVTGLPPYSHSKKSDLIMYMKELEIDGESLTVMIDPRTKWPHEVACKLFDIAKACSSFDSRQRPSMKQVFDSIQEIIDRFC